MGIKYSTFLLILLSGVASAGPELGDGSIQATFAPPHNEPVVGDRVARYRLRAEQAIDWGAFSLNGQYTAWGVQPWQRPHVVGHGLDAWENSHWGVEQWRSEWSYQIRYRPMTHFNFFVEHRNTDWSDVSPQGSYWNLFGIEVTW